MIAALSRAESWVLFMVCIGVGVVVYVAIVGRRAYQRMEDDALGESWRLSLELPPPADFRVLSTVYDWQARGDFE